MKLSSNLKALFLLLFLFNVSALVISFVSIKSIEKSFISEAVRMAETRGDIIFSAARSYMDSPKKRGIIDFVNDLLRYYDQIGEKNKINAHGLKFIPSVNLKLKDHEPFQERKEHYSTGDNSREIITADELLALSGKEVKKVQDGFINRISPVKLYERCLSCHEGKTGETVGVISISVSIANELADIKRIKNKVAFICLIIIVLSSGFAFLLINKFFISRVVKMSETAKLIAETGNLEHKMSVIHRDEIGQLANNFNQMTDRLKVSQEGLIQMEKLSAMGKLAASTAHELKGPLTSIRGYTDITLAMLTGDDPIREQIRIIQEECERGSFIVKNLLLFSKKGISKREPADISRLIYDTVNLIKHHLLTKGIESKISIADGIPKISIDPDKIKQVLFNLLFNGADAMPKGGRLDIGASIEEGRRIVISIRDTGIGIEDKDIEKIFEPFFTTKGDKDGTGLGLYICKNIINSYGGEIGVKSEPGRGTEFIVRLPIASA